MAGGITPNRTVTIPLGDYNSDHYLTLLYQAMVNRGWHIGYFDHDGIVAYTNISWSSYSEEVSARIKNNSVVIKSECVGYQALFTDYGKNRKNIDLLLDEIVYAEFHLQQHLEATTGELMNAVPEKQFLNLNDPPMAGKEQLRGFFSPFVPVKKYFITPLLLILNTAIFLVTSISINILPVILLRKSQISPGKNFYEKIYLFMGFNNRTQVLQGQVWRLFTNIFLHFSAAHLIGNMIVLVYIGSLIECKLGKWNFLLMYLFCGITASMASVIWSGAEISAGASGAIFGLFGILLALLSTEFYERSARKALLISTAIFVGYNIIPVGAGIDHAAHFGGLVSGYILGMVAYMRLNHRNVFIKKWGIALTGAVAVVVFVACGLAFTPQYQTTEFEKLVQRTETASGQINADFYHNNDSVTKPQKLALIEHDALPKLAGLKKIAGEFTRLTLPRRLKKEAAFRASLINLECRFYQLLYLEFKEENRVKYRPEIADVTNRINKVRSEWGEAAGD